ncbi:receptor-like protein kinase THESEUS 1 [Macadamia integrifolia]|uniref:receptor-like protein kinase THESEUS 1 n=1 Tax=Macadamia integrifolia TaxID=60698 RepID=UPI001C52E56E|nr:receptor-like protein kinase THESEUS 1 [Macadamia integrifolia]
MSKSYAPIVGVAAGGLALVVIVIVFMWFCMLQCYACFGNNSFTLLLRFTVEWNRQAGSSSAGGPPLSRPQKGKQFMLYELEDATKQFSESNLIGHGSFGLVYKGLLSDGTVVAVKRRRGLPRQEHATYRRFITETLLAFLVTAKKMAIKYSGQVSNTQLEFKQRLSIALGAAKGLHHLHWLKPPVAHKNFKTANVLVDENFTAKVSDAGVSKLFERIEEASPSSSSIDHNDFQDPETGQSRLFYEMSDIYSFGIFLLELVTSREASQINLRSGESFEQWVKSHASSKDLVDHQLAGNFNLEGMKDLIKLTFWCMSLEKPKMEMVVTELDRILEKEMTSTTIMGEGTATVTLGSQLFT